VQIVVSLHHYFANKTIHIKQYTPVFEQMQSEYK